MLGSANVCWLATAGSPLKRCSFIHGPYQSSGCHNLPEWEKCSMLLAEESVSTVISNFEGYSFLDTWHFGLPYYYLSSAFTHMQVKICFPLKLALKNQSSEKNQSFLLFHPLIWNSASLAISHWPAGRPCANSCQSLSAHWNITNFFLQTWKILSMSGGAGYEPSSNMAIA